MRKFHRFCLYLVVVATAALLQGCFGSFSLTRTIYHANNNVYASVPGDATQRKIAQSAVMWLFIPVYAGAGIADAAVFNVIEFWTGNRTEISQLQQNIGKTTVALEPSVDGREAVMTVTQDGRVISQDRLVKISETALEVRDMKGHVRGVIVKGEDGHMRFHDLKGHILEATARH